MIKTIIVDDEPNLGDGLKRMLETHHTDVKVEAVCYNIDEAVNAFNTIRPDLAFLDVQLENGQTIFDILKKFSEINFKIIFTTGFNRYAIQAIKFSAIDYLMKPIDANELKIAVEKYRMENINININKVESLLSAWSNPGDQQNKIPLPSMTGYDLITVSDIIFCEGVSNQTSFVLKNDKKILISMTLKECEDLLVPYNFFRTHKSYLINLNHVKRYLKGKDGTGMVVLNDGRSLTVSRGFRERFIEKLGTM